MDTQRATAYINLHTLERNFKSIKASLSKGVKFLAVVKADAYGHGMVNVAERLQVLGVDYLGVANIDEALELRENYIETPILVMGGLFPWEDGECIFDHNLTVVVYDLNTIKRLAMLSREKKKPAQIHIKIDTGMGRLGFREGELPLLIDTLREVEGIHVEGIMSHFSSSEIKDEYGYEQIERFKKAVEVFRENGYKPELLHMANSWAIVNYPEAQFDMVRVGIALYGSMGTEKAGLAFKVEQVMKVTSRIALIKDFPPGCPLSYGRTFTTDKEMRIAYIPFGYGDGYPRALSNKGHVLIKDKRCRILGRVCMDWLLVDVTDLKVSPGDEVILLGSGREDGITADEIAHLAGTIPYEILCKISKRVLRLYV
ncbi:MAG: alanine racemase [Syntrophorhabdaceae bacterium]|nr:alanine racemase [Syntrophorhabdaceae bacterium]